MRKTISILFIIVFNLVPIFGVAFFNWQPFEAFWFFWVETLIMALFNAIRIVFSQAQTAEELNTNRPMVYHVGKGMRYLIIRTAVFLFYAVFIITFIGFVANVNKDKSIVFSTILFRNQFFNLGLLISIFSQSYYLITGYFRNGAYFTARPDDYGAIFDGRQIVMHVAIVVGALGSIFLIQKTSLGSYSSIVIIGLLCICKCIFDLISIKMDTNKVLG
jgi:hypothetical protein